MQNDTQQQSLEPPRRSFKRLTPDGYRLLTDFRDNVTLYPTVTQRLDLLAKIQALPDCDWYDKTKISSWFQHQQTRYKVKESKGVSASQAQLSASLIQVRNTLFPSFRNVDYLRLEQLLAEDPNPSETTLRVWSLALSVDLSQLARWVIWQKEREQKKNSSTSTASTTSQTPQQSRPEPGPFSISVPRTQASPIQTTTNPRAPSHLPTPESSTSPEPRVRQIPESVRRIRELAETIKGSLTSGNDDTPNEKAPETMEEFNRLFKTHEDSMSTFMKRVKSGDFQQIGVGASFASPSA
ncbi:unnamed protein product [Somion occarium]|uniref:Uncharacterized protein n=1 Tax=Somion occarium TaxID=3059160 RepID=A0ABP1CZ06_9APHY